jgi:glycosyltransferase involved in cell wall biosynthesis
VAVFVGSRWPPNIYGVGWVMARVWPEVAARLPNARLRVVGRGLTADLWPSVSSRVEIVGEVPDVRVELAHARVVLCPVFFGAGVPTKLLDAAASGKPALTTTYCSRVLGASPFEASDDPGYWQERLVALLENPDEARDAGARALAYAYANWDEASWAEDMAAVERAVRVAP